MTSSRCRDVQIVLNAIRVICIRGKWIILWRMKGALLRNFVASFLMNDWRCQIIFSSIIESRNKDDSLRDSTYTDFAAPYYYCSLYVTNADLSD